MTPLGKQLGAIGLGAALIATGAHCRPRTARDTSAATAVTAYAAALERDDARAAWALLSSSVRAKTRFEEFERVWKATAAERHRQAAQMAEGLRGDPKLRERALVRYGDASTVRLQRERERWALESDLVSGAVAHTPADAVRIFASALNDRDLSRLLAILARRRRDTIGEFLARYAASLSRNQARASVVRTGPGRAEVLWDDEGARYKIVVVREGDEWRVDDIDVIPATENLQP